MDPSTLEAYHIQFMQELEKLNNNASSEYLTTDINGEGKPLAFE